MANGKPPRRTTKPRASSGAEDLGPALAAVNIKRVRKTKTNNPSKVPVAEGLRVRRTTPVKLPTAAELLRDTATPPLGMGRRSLGMPTAQELFDSTAPSSGLISAADLFAQGEDEGLTTVNKPDRSEYLSPPPSIEPGRPRALEASYNPDTRTLRVVFRNGGTYEYFGVLPQTWRALKSNRSFGQTLDRLVLNTYEFEKVAY